MKKIIITQTGVLDARYGLDIDETDLCEKICEAVGRKTICASISITIDVLTEPLRVVQEDE